MKHLFVTVLVLLSITFLCGTSFEDFIRGIGQELCAQTAQKPISVVLDMANLQKSEKQETDALYYFVREIMHTELVSSGVIKPLDMAKTDIILKSLSTHKRDYVFYNELGRIIHEELQISPDALLNYKITDLGTILKFEFYLTDVKSLTEIATVVYEYPADEQTDKLLNKPVRPKAEIKPVKPVAKPRAVREPAKPDLPVNNVVFQENFSRYNEGDPLPDWGNGAVVVKAKDGRKFIGSQIKGKHKLAQTVNFPNPGALQFDFTKPVNSSTLTLIDSKKQEIQLSFDEAFGYLSVWISGTVAKKLPCAGINTLRLTRDSATFKVYVNGQYLLSGVYNDFQDITGFVLDLYEGQNYTDFIIEKI